MEKVPESFFPRDGLASFYIFMAVSLLVLFTPTFFWSDVQPLHDLSKLDGVLESYEKIGLRTQYVRYVIETELEGEIVLTSSTSFVKQDKDVWKKLDTVIGRGVTVYYQVTPEAFFRRGFSYHTLRQLETDGKVLLDYAKTYKNRSRPKARYIYYYWIAFCVTIVVSLLLLFIFRRKKLLSGRR